MRQARNDSFFMTKTLLLTTMVCSTDRHDNPILTISDCSCNHCTTNNYQQTYTSVMGKAEVILSREVSFAASILISFILGSASLLLATLYVHRNYLEDALLSNNASNCHPMITWVMTKRQQHHRVSINRLS